MIRQFTGVPNFGDNKTSNIAHICTSDGKGIPIWTDKNGKEYRCECEISDAYLKNIIVFLQNKLWNLPFPMFQGEMAQYYAERERNRENEELLAELLFFRGIAGRREVKINEKR